MDQWTAVMRTLAASIAAVVAGDLNSLSTVRVASHRDLQDAAAMLPPIFVSRIALAKVLAQWRGGLSSAEDVQAWASFIRRGHVSGTACGAIKPIDIEYDAGDEELIVEIIGRLDEIGDQIDGHIDACEQDGMLRALRA